MALPAMFMSSSTAQAVPLHTLHQPVPAEAHSEQQRTKVRRITLHAVTRREGGPWGRLLCAGAFNPRTPTAPSAVEPA